jgi:hypothetical protein
MTGAPQRQIRALPGPELQQERWSAKTLDVP